MNTKTFFTIICMMATTAISAQEKNKTPYEFIPKNYTLDSEVWENLPTDEYLQKDFLTIRNNFEQIISIPNAQWTKIVTKNREGSEVRYYFWGKNNLKKMIVQYADEENQQLTEYYLYKGQPSFVFEQNRRKDIENLDETEELRSYFNMHGKLIYRLESGDCGAPFSDDYLQAEQTRIMIKFKDLLELLENQ